MQTERTDIFRDRRRRPGSPWIGAGIAVVLSGQLFAAEPAAVRRHRVDPAVVQAAGQPHGAHACSQCRRSACPQCRLAVGHHQGHGQCQHGLCPAHCPVRPDVFGFYGTRWRKWPGSGVIQASNNAAATPAQPPQTEVPDATEESLEPEPASEDLPAPDEPEMSGERKKASAGKAAEGGGSIERQTKPDAAHMLQPAGSSVESPGDDGEEAVSRTAWRTFTAAGVAASER